MGSWIGSNGTVCSRGGVRTTEGPLYKGCSRERTLIIYHHFMPYPKCLSLFLICVWAWDYVKMRVSHAQCVWLDSPDLWRSWPRWGSSTLCLKLPIMPFSNAAKYSLKLSLLFRVMLWIKIKNVVTVYRSIWWFYVASSCYLLIKSYIKRKHPLNSCWWRVKSTYTHTQTHTHTYIIGGGFQRQKDHTQNTPHDTPTLIN